MGQSKGKYPGGFNCLQVGYWNVRSLVEAYGNITTGTSRPGGRPLAVNCKVEFSVCELKRFGMNVVGISEAKWFGQAMYLVDGCAVVHSGRLVPVSDGPALHGKGVGVVLDPVMMMAWRMLVRFGMLFLLVL